MSLRNYDPANPINTFSATSEVDYCEEKLTEILLLLGYSADQLNVLTIDEVVEKIREIFPYQRIRSELREFGQVLTSAQINVNIRCIALTSSVRRLWYRYNIAKAAADA